MPGLPNPKPQRNTLPRTACFVLVGVLLSGCAFTVPYVGQGPHPQVTRGAPAPLVDTLGNILSLFDKLLLWNRHFNNHAISEATERSLIRYLEAKRLPVFRATVYRLNQYAPLDDLRRLIHNHAMAWPYRLLLGVPTTILTDVLLPGRLFPWGDYFNPYTNVVHLYSDDAAIALHEAGHAYDFADFPHRGTYALLRSVPFLDLYQEWQATDNAITYLIDIGDRPAEFHAYRTLWPAYGTYVGGYLPIPLPLVSSVAGALSGHLAGYFKVKGRRRYYQRMDTILQTPSTGLPPTPPSLPSRPPHALPPQTIPQ